MPRLKFDHRRVVRPDLRLLPSRAFSVLGGSGFAAFVLKCPFIPRRNMAFRADAEGPPRGPARRGAVSARLIDVLGG